MLRRYMCLITDQGMDAAIPLVDDPEAFRENKKDCTDRAWQKIYPLYSQYGKIIFGAVFDSGVTPHIDNEKGLIYGLYSRYYSLSETGLNKEIEEIWKQRDKEIIDFGVENGSIDPGNAFGYNLRKTMALGGKDLFEPIFAVDDSDFEVLRSRMSPWHSAFHILDGLINGETDIGRFRGKSKIIKVMNKMDDDSKYNDKSKMKKLRRVFFDRISGKGEDDDDII